MMNVFYLYNENKRIELNSAGHDYTPAYIPAILKYIGAGAKACASNEVSQLGENDVLIIGAEEIDEIPQNPGAVILLGSEVGKNPVRAERKPFIYDFYLNQQGTQIPLFVPISETDGEFETIALTAKKSPALVKRGLKTWVFRFDLAATVWYSGDGFEKDEPLYGFFIGRTPDTRPVPDDFDTSLPFNDVLLDELEKILLELKVPMLYRLPPMEDGSVPDFALHISGDDDHTSAELNLTASKVMHELGLPYHINAMPSGDRFIFDIEQMREMESLGCEIALHSDFTVMPYTAESQKHMAEVFEKCLGRAAKTNVNHCLVQGGSSAERVRWLSECGIIADNGKMGEIDPSDINAFNLCGFAFGTAFPRFTCDNAEHNNAFISTMEIPISYYEPRLGGKYNDEVKITDYIDEAAEHGRIIDFFIHPHYLYPAYPDSAYSIPALKLAQKHWETAGYKPLLSSTDRIAEFWQNRSQAELHVEDGKIIINCADKMLLRIPIKGDSECKFVLVDGEKVAAAKKQIGSETEYIVPILSGGSHVIELK